MSALNIVLVIVVAIFSSVTAPLILAWRTAKMHREDRLADWERQDTQALLLKTEQSAQAAAAGRARLDLAASQKAIADQAAETARLLVVSNERVARTARTTEAKLDSIHVLVNSNMTHAMQSELDATVRERAVMRELMELKRAAGQQPTQAVLTAIEAAEARIAELRTTLADRAAATEKAGIPVKPDEPGADLS